MNIGDIVVLRDGDRFSVIKILRIDPHPGLGDTFHCLNYWAVANEPTENEIDSLRVECYHAPIAGGSIRAEGKVICNRPVSEEDLIGFMEYLKQTDFARYAQETGRDAGEIVSEANRHYERANELGENGEFKEAIEEYTKAVELFPLFYEAVDNRGMTYMDMGDLRAAVSDFEWSLELNRKNHLAFLLKAKCLVGLGELDEADSTIEEGIRLYPEHQEEFLRVREIAGSVKQQLTGAGRGNQTEEKGQRGDTTRKPRWKFWA